MDPSAFIPLSSRPTSFPATEKVSLKCKWEELSKSKSSSGSSANSYDGPIVATEELRAGFDEPLPKSPLSIDSLPGMDISVPRYTECQLAASDIFEQAGLDYESVQMVLVRGQNQTDFKPTIMVRVPEGTDRLLWRPTLITLGYMIHAKDSLDLQVILLEPRAEENEQAFSLRFGDPLIHTWQAGLKNEIWEVIMDLDWLQLSICNWGLTEEASIPTVLIIIEEEDQTPWGEVIAKVQQLCDSSSATSNPQVLVVKGKFIGAYLDDKRGFEGQRAYEESIAMGHSIGVDAHGGGTMGGYFNLVDPKNSSETPVFCTNWHVVRPQDPELPVEFDDGPQPYGAWPQGISNVVQCPAQSDIESQIAHLKGQRQAHEISARLAYLRKRVDDGTATAQETTAYQVALAALAEVQGDFQAINANNKKSSLRFGQCKMGSGFRTVEVKQRAKGAIHGKLGLDWAIGEPVSRRIAGNMLPPQETLDALAGRHEFTLGGKSHVESFGGQLFQGQNVFKVGRTTGLTVGRLEFTTTITRISRPSNSANTSLWPRRTTIEHFVIRGLFGRHFNLGGDSGSWVLDQMGDLCGLVWGGVTRDNVCYFTPIDVVIADIEKYTGKEVRIYKAQ